MKKLIIILLIAIPCLVKAQKLQKPDIDKITGDTTISTSVEKIYSKASWSGTVGEQLRLMISKTKGNVYLSFIIQTGGVSFIIPDDGQAFLKLNDGSVITLTGVKYEGSSYVRQGVGSNGHVTYPITTGDLTKLQNSKVVFIRIQSVTKNFEYDINNNNADKIKAVAGLIKL